MVTYEPEERSTICPYCEAKLKYQTSDIDNFLLKTVVYIPRDHWESQYFIRRGFYCPSCTNLILYNPQINEFWVAHENFRDIRSVKNCGKKRILEIVTENPDLVINDDQDINRQSQSNIERRKERIAALNRTQ